MTLIRKGGNEHAIPWRVMRDVLHGQLPHLVVGEWEPYGELGWQHSRTNHGRVHYLAPDLIDPKSFWTRLQGWCERAQCEPISPHQLRYSCATNLARCGMPVQMIQSLLNHSDLSTTMRYVRTSNVEIREWALRRSFGPFG